MIAIGRSSYLYNTIKHLNAKGYKIDAIVTDDGYPEYERQASDFKKLAEQIRCPFFKTRTLSAPEIINIVKSKRADLAISVNWKYIIPENFISLFPLGIYNLHMGNLPDYKGNATINWSIINGEKFIYVNVHKVTPDLDSGDIIARKKILIKNTDYIQDIIHNSVDIAPVLFETAIKKIIANPGYKLLKGTKNGLRCYPRLPMDSQIVWNESSENICRLIRASSHPYTGSYTFLLNGEKVIIWKASVNTSQKPFLAIPGHIIEINQKSGVITVACNKSLLDIQEFEYCGKILKASTIIKSIRTRFINIPNAM